MKTLPATYRGRRFRSRTEARWAVFFDHMGLVWEYEREGFDLDGSWYLPDFWLPQLKCWFEVKGKEPTAREWHVGQLLARDTGKPVYLRWGGVVGILSADDNCARLDPGNGDRIIADLGQLWCTCPDCGRVALAPMGNGNAICGLDGPPKFTADAAALNHAYSAARRQVFWKPGGVSC